jgi:hypothetical protein
MKTSLRKAIRYAYIATIVVLAFVALLTYRELRIQRSVPVILPGYWFYIVEEPGKGSSVVQTHGTWYVASGPQRSEPLQTTTIECRKTTLQCVESTALVSVSEKGFLEVISTVFKVERWDDREIVTKAEPGACSSRSITLDLANRETSSTVSDTSSEGNCKEVPQKLKLEGGSKALSEALQRGKL